MVVNFYTVIDTVTSIVQFFDDGDIIIRWIIVCNQMTELLDDTKTYSK